MATRGQAGGAVAGGGRGRLTRHLQGAFLEACPAGWACTIEASLVLPPAAARLGFEPRADVLLTRADDARRIWVEFEVSRADPVANQAKFASAAFFEGCPPGDALVSMASRHIAPGRKALMASTAMFMRAVGIPAFQVDLLPDLDGPRIKALNAAPPEELAVAPIDVVAEIDRVIAVADARLVNGWHRIHLADNAFTVGANVRAWNAELADASVAASWARRRVRFLAWDPASGLFAPSKFCAFVPAGLPERTSGEARVVREPPGGMNAALYFSLGEQDPRFDGHVARKHLERRLRYRVVPLSGAEGPLAAAWRLWRDRCPLTVADDVVALVPPVA